MGEARRVLTVIYEGVAKRTAAIREHRPWWPCRKGCDDCCRSLGGEPAFSALEWEMLDEGIEGLDAATRSAVETRLEALVDALPRLERTGAPISCPFLGEAGECLVYEQRPATCRSYGYYQCRDVGHFCEKVEGAIQERAPAHVVWGNQNALARAVGKLAGPPVPLGRWYRDRQR